MLGKYLSPRCIKYNVYKCWPILLTSLGLADSSWFCCSFFSCPMPFLSPSQQFQSTERLVTDSWKAWKWLLLSWSTISACVVIFKWYVIHLSVLIQMSSCTYECLDVYKDTVDNTCDAVDSGIKVHFLLIFPLHSESRKTRHQTLGHKFTNCYPIFKIFSLADWAVNLQQIHV